MGKISDAIRLGNDREAYAAFVEELETVDRIDKMDLILAAIHAAREVAELK